MTEFKLCKSCGKQQKIEEFYKHHSHKDGRVNKCRTCISSQGKTPAQKEAKRAYDAKYKKAHPDRKRGPNPAEYLRQWRLQNPDKVRASERRRTERVSGKTGNLDRAWDAMRDHFGEICLCCGKDESLTKDHVIPVSLGGTDHISNIQPLCQTCNSSKGQKIVDYRNVDSLIQFLKKLNF